jgi:vancomycin resistance protein YoaR
VLSHAQQRQKGGTVPEDNDRRWDAEQPTERIHIDPDLGRAAGGPAPESDTERTTRIPPVDSGAPTRSGTSISGQLDPEPEDPDLERTEQLAALPSDFPDLPTQAIPAVQDEPAYRDPEPAPEPLAVDEEPEQPRSGKRSPAARAGLVVGAVVAALGLLYVGDLALTSGQVPRGTVVAGVEIGGMERAAAEAELREQLGARLDEPVELQADKKTATIDPNAAGLRIDFAATVEHAGEQPLNPFTRFTSLFTTREVAPVTEGDRQQLIEQLKGVQQKLEQEPVEGDIRFEGATPVPVNPIPGHRIDLDEAADVVIRDWAKEGPVRLPHTKQPVSTTADGVQEALREIAEPAVSAPVTVRGEGKDAVFSPEDIGKALRFTPNGNGGLKAELDVPTAADALLPQLEETVKPSKDAEIVLEGNRPVVRPSEDGVGIDWDKTLEPAMDVLKRSEDRSLDAVYKPEPAEFTTEQANELGIKEVVGEFTTGGFEPASGENIRRVAEQVNGAIVKPGETFSLNGHTGPRTAAQGYVESGIIKDGRPGKAVGGGISQFATTLYNAAYFAGMEDVEHKAHSYYISRYPAGREATVFQNPDGSSVIDVKFKNVSNSGILITTRWTPSSITVTLWGTKQFDVTSETSERTDITPPKEVPIPPGEPCSPSNGAPGFTVYDTRTIRDLTTGEVRTERTKTVYEPQPIIKCDAPPPAP